VVRLLNQAKRYPRLALLREEEGQVLVAIDVAADGTITDVRVEESSAFESLNRGALATVRALGKLPPVPAELGEGAHLHVPILFQLQGAPSESR
jgi:protein TonB